MALLEISSMEEINTLIDARICVYVSIKYK